MWAVETLPRGAGYPRCLPTTQLLPMGLTGSPARVRAAAPQRLPQMAGLLVPGASNAPAFASSLWNQPMGPACCMLGCCGVRTGMSIHLGLGYFFTVATPGMQRCKFRLGVKCWHGQFCTPMKPRQGLAAPAGTGDINWSWGQLPSPSKPISVGHMADAVVPTQNEGSPGTSPTHIAARMVHSKVPDTLPKPRILRSEEKEKAVLQPSAQNVPGASRGLASKGRTITEKPFI